MAIYSSSDAIRGALAQSLGYEYVYRVVPWDEEGSGPTRVLRVRSRDRHDPGDGNYSCSHVHAKRTGWSWGTTAYLLDFDEQVYWESGDLFRVSWTGTVYYWEMCYWIYGKTFYYRDVYTLQNPRASEHARWLHEAWSTTRWGDYTMDQMKSTPADHYTRGMEQWGRRQDLPNDPYFGGCHYENRYLLDQIELGTIKTFDTYLEEVYIDACSSLPRIAMNNIANIGQIIGTMASFVKGYSSIPSMLDALSDSWLGYRYEYLTTKSDINELVSYVDRMRHIGSLDLVTGHGRHDFPAKDGSTYRLKCSVQLPPTMYQDVQSWAERFGVALDGYNMWDLIPYSFIVDWFLPIGPMLEKARDADYAARLTPSVVWYSITHEYTNSFGCRQCDYVRWQGEPHAPAALPITIIPQLSSKGVTWAKRGTDLFALLL